MRTGGRGEVLELTHKGKGRLAPEEEGKSWGSKETRAAAAGERHRKAESWGINDSVRQHKDMMGLRKKDAEHVKRGHQKGR